MPVTDTGTGLRRFLCPGQKKKRGGGEVNGGLSALAGTSSKGSFISIDRIVHTIAIVAPVMEHCLEQEIVEWV